MIALDRSKLVRTFADDFDQPLDLKRWKTDYWFSTSTNPIRRYLRGKENGDERQIYSDAAYNGINPFATYNDSLAITARALTGTDPRNGGREFSSGLITTEQSFSQQYGYFEMRAKLPQEPGLVPAFWLLAQGDPAIKTAQILNELDVMEIVTDDPGTLHMTIHRSVNSKHVQDHGQVATGGTGWVRSYGMLWSADFIVWYLDDKEVRRIANPGFHSPMYLLANLAVGGWAKPTFTKAMRATMLIDSIRAYRLSP